MRAVETTTAVHDNKLTTVELVVVNLTDHLTRLNASVDRLTRWVIVIATVSLLIDNQDPLVKLLGL
mgnify:CR=1 FL=1